MTARFFKEILAENTSRDLWADSAYLPAEHLEQRKFCIQCSWNGYGCQRLHHLQQRAARFFYDADGAGAGAAVQFATLANKSQHITASDFVVAAFLAYFP